VNEDLHHDNANGMVGVDWGRMDVAEHNVENIANMGEGHI
jgi:hypothetical protein